MPKNNNDFLDSESKSGYLYHKEPNRSRRRSSRKTPGWNREDAIPRSTKSRRIKNAHAEANSPRIRTTIIILLGMGLLLFIAQTLNKKDWEEKWRAAKKKNAASAVNANGLGSNTSQVGLASTGVPASPAEAHIDDENHPAHQAALKSSAADELLDQGKAEEAEAAYQESVGLWHENPEAWAGLGQARMAQQKYPEAIKAIAQAIERDLHNPHYHTLQGKALLLAHQPAQAEGSFRQALKNDPEQAEALLQLAMIRKARGDLKQSLEFFDRYLALVTDNPVALRETAFIHASSGRYETAISLLDQAIALKPDWATLYLDAAAAASLVGNYPASFAYLEQARPFTETEFLVEFLKQPAFEKARDSEPGRDYLARLAETPPPDTSLEKE